MAREVTSERQFVVEELRRHLHAGHVTRSELLIRLQPAELALVDMLDAKPELMLDYPWSSFQRMVTALEWVESRGQRYMPTGPIDPETILLGRHGTVAHEVIDLNVLLVGFDSGGRLLIWDLLKRASDTRFRFGSAEELGDIASACVELLPDVILIDLGGTRRLDFDVLARADLLDLERPLVFLISRKDEPKALHLGDRQYLLKEELDERILMRTLRNAHERHLLSIELSRSRQREHTASTQDPMTGLPNRHHFRDELEASIVRAKNTGDELAVLFLDLDRFKIINDTLGHAVGDQLLLEVSKRLSTTIGLDGSVARVGGDEFLAHVVGPPGEFSPESVAGRILDSLSRPMQLGDEEFGVTASIGIARYPDDGRDSDTLIQNADMALYEVKAAGRDGYQLYSRQVGDFITRKREVEARLRCALDEGKLEVYYQPRVDVAKGEIVGCEALLRWFDPELGQVPPSEFVTVAEECGLILPLGDWVFRKACTQWLEWMQRGHDGLRLSINLSAYQIIEGRLRESILRTLWDTGLDPSLVEVEITETALIHNRDVARQVLQELKELGLWLALDDFGTGFSSLSNLRRFPVDIIKIDQSFVRGLLIDENDAALTEAIISIGEKLKLGVVAEGVESLGQRDFLYAHGCHEMQGYLFSRAVPASTFEKLLEAGLPHLDSDPACSS